MATPRHKTYAPFEVRVSQSHLNMHRGWEDCPLANGKDGWCVYLEDRDKDGRATTWLSTEALDEISQWLAETLDMNNAEIDDNLYLWGVTFEHQSDALLCFMRFR
jgi:hypothetical protein